MAVSTHVRASLIGGLSLAVVGGVAAVPVAGSPIAEVSAERSKPGKRPASSPAPQPAAPPLQRLSGDIELTLQTRDDLTLRELLVRAGAAPAEAAKAEELLTQATVIAPNRPVTLFLGKSVAAGRALAGIEFSPRLGLTLQVAGMQGRALRLVTHTVAVDATPRRFRGTVGNGLFWALRAAGVPAEASRDYAAAIGTRLPADQHRPSDRFDLIVEHRRTAAGQSEWGELVYAGLDRAVGRDIRLVRWTMNGESEWAEPGRREQRADALDVPATGPLSSRFGYRLHPILGTGRFHRGIDIRAPMGTPVVAASDGVVIVAGWQGGYGRQVRLAHPHGMSTSYSHLSSIVAAPGGRVARGQLIGFVGSSGLSTGPHLHFEVYDRGRPVDPLAYRTAGTFLAPSDVAAVNARLRQLLSS